MPSPIYLRDILLSSILSMPRSSNFSPIRVHQPNFVFPTSLIFVACLASLILFDSVIKVFSFNMKNGNFYINRVILNYC
jgi:hypothetical protein